MEQLERSRFSFTFLGKAELKSQNKELARMKYLHEEIITLLNGVCGLKLQTLDASCTDQIFR